jgi:hypothetical protein
LKKDKTSKLSPTPVLVNNLSVGNRKFLEGIKDNLGIPARNRTIAEASGISFLKEPQISYEDDFNIENDVLRGENGHFWKIP